MALPTRTEFYRDHLAPCRILPGAPKYSDIGICVVCQEDFNDASYDMVAVSSCSHVFHRKCIIQWTETWGSPRDKCPSCRESMYQYTPMTAQEIQAMQEAQAIQDAESRLSELGPYAAAREAERLWFASMGVSVEGLPAFDDMTEPTHFSDEDGEDIATSLHMNFNPNLSLQVPTFADFGSASPAYSPTFPMYSDASLGESPTSPRYSPPSPRLPPTWPLYAQSTPLYSPTVPIYSDASQGESSTSPVYQPSLPDARNQGGHTSPEQSTQLEQLTQLEQMRGVISSEFTIAREISNVAVVHTVHSSLPNSYLATSFHVNSEYRSEAAVHGAIGYVMVGRTALFYY